MVGVRFGKRPLFSAGRLEGMPERSTRSWGNTRIRSGEQLSTKDHDFMPCG